MQCEQVLTPATSSDPRTPNFVAWFDDLSRGDFARAGGKGANLGEMARANLPVPPGFVVTADAFLQAMETGGVRDELWAVMTEACATTTDRAAPALAADRLQSLVREAGVPDDIADQVLAAYHRLGDQVLVVAVRSSAVGEDTPAMSFAGMHETFVNVAGDSAVLERLVDCWASLYSERVISYRSGHAVAAEPAIAVVVQQFVDADQSGVMFTADPSTGDRNRLVIEAGFGLGEVVVGGQVEPDTYVLTNDGPRLVEVRVGHQDHKVVPGWGGLLRLDLDEQEAGSRVLSDDEALALARLGSWVESHYDNQPQDIEWAIADGRIFVVQTRPITALAPAPMEPGGAMPPATRPLVRGLAASSGCASGNARVLIKPTEGRCLAPGEILVAPTTSPDWVPAIRRAAALVTDSGGVTCHVAIVARELGVPAVVGARLATLILRPGEMVTVDGSQGAVYQGGPATGA